MCSNGHYVSVDWKFSGKKEDRCPNEQGSIDDMSRALTLRQSQILKFITDFILKHHHAPSRREIMRHFQFKSTTAVNHHLEAFKRKGYLTQASREARALEVPGLSVTTGFPIVKKVVTGKPILVEENLHGVLALDYRAAPWRDAYFIRSSEENMSNAGILAGDYILVCPQPSAKEGEMVAALLGSELFIRYFTLKKDYILLYRDKTDQDPLSITRGRDDFRLLGKVVAAVRFLEGPMASS